MYIFAFEPDDVVAKCGAKGLWKGKKDPVGFLSILKRF